MNSKIILICVCLLVLASCKTRRSEILEVRSDLENEDLNTEKAIKFIDKAINLTPKNSRLYFKKSIYLQHLSRHDEALEAIDIAIKNSDPINLEYSRKAKIFFELDEIDSAFFYHNLSVNKAASKHIALNLRASDYLKIGMLDSALSDINRALILEQDYIEGFFTRGEILYESQKDYSEALSNFSYVIDKTKNLKDFDKLFLGQAYFFRGACFFRLSKLELACLDWNEAINFGVKEVNLMFEESCN